MQIEDTSPISSRSVCPSGWAWLGCSNKPLERLATTGLFIAHSESTLGPSDSPGLGASLRCGLPGGAQRWSSAISVSLIFSAPWPDGSVSGAVLCIVGPLPSTCQAHLPQCDNQKCLQVLLNVPWRAKLAWLRTTPKLKVFLIKSLKKKPSFSAPWFPASLHSHPASFPSKSGSGMALGAVCAPTPSQFLSNRRTGWTADHQPSNGSIWE